MSSQGHRKRVQWEKGDKRGASKMGEKQQKRMEKGEGESETQKWKSREAETHEVEYS